MTNSMNEVMETDLMFVIGSNTTENHPVIATKMRQAKKNGAKLIVADPRRIDLAKIADLYLPIRPGTNIALINAMSNEIIRNGLYDRKYIEDRTENFDRFIEHIKDFTPETVSKVCCIDAEDIRKAARMYAEAKNAGIYYAMGITQHISGSHAVMLLSNLAMLCGNIGKEFAGINPLRGQNNVQGACDMGCIPADFPGYQKVNEKEMVEKFEKAWSVKLPSKKGLTLSEIIHGGSDGSTKFLYIVGENPMMTDPDLKKVKKDLEGVEFIVMQDIFLNETASLADVVLPASSFAEKDGTFTNTERRVQRIRKALEPVGNSKPDWQIFMEIMNRMGLEQKYNNPSEIMEEIASLAPEYGGITYDRIDHIGLQWPCYDKDHPGTKFLHKEKFSRSKGRAQFVTVDNISSAELVDEEYPFIMTTGRNLYQYHTRTMTGRVEELDKKAPNPYMEMNSSTVEKLGFKDGEEVRVASRRGWITIPIRATDMIGEDVLFVPFHYADAKVNYLTNTKIDHLAKIPELKVAAVRVERLQ
jgi:formate dehydrogenase alpha subunit